MRKLAFLFLSLFAFCTASAQVTTSSMSGRVADTDGQPIIGATIVAVHTPTGTQYATASTRNGQFNLGGMRVGGPYDVEVSFIGCNTEKIEGIYLTIGEEATLDFVLREDSQSIGEVVVVGKANPVFNANRTGAQEVVTLEMMEKLPTTSRSLDEFVKLTPMSSGKNFAGTSYRFNNVTVDGASFNNSFGLSSALGAQGTEPISLESIEQVQVMIAPYDVRNGGFTGGGINSVTKSGTNEWHASAYMYTKSPELQGHRVRDYVGHGVGAALHESPEVPNYGKPGHGIRLQRGMVIAVEPMVNMGGHEIDMDDPNGWTVRTKDGLPTAQWEVQLVITETGYELLSW